MHDVPSPGVRKSSFFKRILDEAPRDPVICLFQVKLDEHETYTPPLSTHGVENFLINYYVIGNLMTKDKAALAWLGAVRCGINFFGLLVKVLVIVLYTTLHRLIGRICVRLSGLFTFGISGSKVLLDPSGRIAMLKNSKA